MMSMQYRGRWFGAALVISCAAIAACGGSVASVDTTSSSGGSGTGTDPGSGTGTGTRPGDPETDAGAIVDASTPKKDAAPNDPECPKTFQQQPGSCNIGLSCTYPEGTCSCVGYCGGVQPPPGDFSHWVCGPKKDDRCPDERPKEGTACKTPGGPVCTYGDCCMQTFRCGQSGKWEAGPMQCPP